jgi:hypothetical protein
MTSPPIANLPVAKIRIDIVESNGPSLIAVKPAVWKGSKRYRVIGKLTRAGPLRVKMRNTQPEQMFSGLLPGADIDDSGGHVSNVP